MTEDTKVPKLDTVVDVYNYLLSILFRIKND